MKPFIDNERRFKPFNPSWPLNSRQNDPQVEPKSYVRPENGQLQEMIKRADAPKFDHNRPPPEDAEQQRHSHHASLIFRAGIARRTGKLDAINGRLPLVERNSRGIFLWRGEVPKALAHQPWLNRWAETYWEGYCKGKGWSK